MVFVRGLCHSTLAQSSCSFSFCCIKFLFRCLIFFRVQNNICLGTLCIYAFGPTLFWNYVVIFAVVYNITTYLAFYVFA